MTDAKTNIDSLLMTNIIEIVNEIFEKSSLSLPLERKDELTGLLYDVLEGKKIDRLSLQKQIERLLKIM
jgi:hypothetical protein